jgi:hypothetical protein
MAEEALSVQVKVRKCGRDRHADEVHSPNSRPCKKLMYSTDIPSNSSNDDEDDNYDSPRGTSEEVEEATDIECHKGPTQGGIISCRENKSGVPRSRMTRFCFIHINDDELCKASFDGCPPWCKGVLLTFCQVNSNFHSR